MFDINKPFFIGVTRFSLFIPGSPNWNLSSSTTVEEYMQKLYSSERLDSRINIFVNISLPQIEKASKGHNVRHIVQYSSHLPEKYKLQLEDAKNKYNFLELFCNDSADHHSNIINTVAKDISRNYSSDEVLYAWYRVDDDDLLGTRFFEMASQYIQSEHAGYCLSFGSGYTAFYNEGKIWDIRECYRPKTSVGQLYISKYTKSTDSFIEAPRQNHTQVDKWAPTIIDSRYPNFITMLHENQDGYKSKPDEKIIERIYREQSNAPYVEYSDAILNQTFPEFSKHIAKSEYIYFNSLKNATSNTQYLSTEPIELPYSLHTQGLVEFDYHFTSSSPSTESRVFISLEYADSLSRPRASGVWQNYGNKELVTGIPANKNKIAGRVVFISDDKNFPHKIKVWNSKQTQKPISVDFLSIRS
ncbi:glycosyltransferase [Rothia sp. (in: high G+C Gram-positive bacteria)]|uniref:glycosyltransferase n=1 Tax=Rothia sp. (in: high G+C Gram-positive bacteria) TaxID=1885016 RepID=UPI003216393C